MLASPLRKAVTKRMSRTRLSPEKWLAAGVDALIASWPSALAAEPLARALGTTKGSFYWHFKDVPTFQSALIETWRKQALANLGRAVGAEGRPDTRLRQFGHDILADQTEAALRLWAPSHSELVQVLQALDHERLTYISLLLREMGLGNQNFAIALQAALVGLPQLSGAKPQAFDTLVDTVLALS